MLCSICFTEIPPVGTWTDGNNAEPVNTGRCCNECDNNVVIPARLTMMMTNVSADVYRDMLQQQLENLQRQLMRTPSQTENVSGVAMAP